jgi:6-pyruvoyltetrahydropterin/6-carboxytetrahydropterin synthase
MYTISKQFHFCASHELNYLPAGHKCHGCHGHNYVVEVILEAEKLNKNEFVRDYKDLSLVQDYIDKNLDHRHLNHALGFKTSSENIAKHLFDYCKLQFPETIAVRISETPGVWAVYSDK